jgi:ERCC4-type nuclease
VEFSFARWANPTTQVVWIYVNGPEVTGAGVKIWLAQSTAGACMLTNQRKSYGVAFGLLRRALAERVGAGELRSSDLTALSWDELLALAPAQPAKPRVDAPAKPAWRDRAVTHYTAEHARTLDPNVMAHPVPAPLVLLVDHREPAALIAALQEVANLVVRVETLPVGDYIALNAAGEPALVVERKTVHDFTQSIVENAKRLFHQTVAMREINAPGVLLLEGDLYGNTRLTLPALSGTLSYLAVLQRVSVIPTLSMEHSIYQIVKMSRHAVFGLGYDLGLRGASPDKTPRKAAAFTLEGIPGVSATRARGLLARFGSIAAVAAASLDALCEVDGIGRKTAQSIQEVLTTNVLETPAVGADVSASNDAGSSSPTAPAVAPAPLPFVRPVRRRGKGRGSVARE